VKKKEKGKILSIDSFHEISWQEFIEAGTLKKINKILEKENKALLVAQKDNEIINKILYIEMIKEEK